MTIVSSAHPVAISEELDVRQLLARGEEPFQAIMSAAGRVPADGALRLRVSFEPVPLYAVLARQGFSHATRQLAADDWEVIFSRSGNVALADSAAVQKAAVEADDAVVRLDVSDLVPPEPMVRILEVAAQLRPDQTLFVEHHRRPVYLYPQLEAQGFVHETREIGPGRVHILIRRAEAAG